MQCWQESIHSKKECLRIKLMAEQEVALLHQQLLAARQALTKAQTENRKLWRQNDTQVPRTPELATLSVATRRDTVATGTVTRASLECHRFERDLQFVPKETQDKWVTEVPVNISRQALPSQHLRHPVQSHGCSQHPHLSRPLQSLSFPLLPPASFFPI